jgi:hypothetical protein
MRGCLDFSKLKCLSLSIYFVTKFSQSDTVLFDILRDITILIQNLNLNNFIITNKNGKYYFK